MMKITHLKIEKLIPPIFDSRTQPNPEKDAELLESIRSYGILEPISVRPSGESFEIIFGHRRFCASRSLGIPSIPCIIINANDELTEVLKAHENIHQLPLSHVDQASHFVYLREHFHMTETEIARLIGRSVAYVSQHLSLLESDQEIIDSVQKGDLTFSVARELVQIDDPAERKRLHRIAAEDGAKAEVVRGWARESNRQSLPQDQQPVYVPSNGNPTYSSNPVFPCQSCDNITPIGQLMVTRMCPECFTSFNHALKEIKRENSTK